MTIFLILAPYGAFALLMLVTSAADQPVRRRRDLPRRHRVSTSARGRSVKMLGAGSVDPVRRDRRLRRTDRSRR